MIDKRSELIAQARKVPQLDIHFDIYPTKNTIDYPYLKALEVHNGEKMKISNFGKTLTFCKYLCNESSDLYEISNLSSYEHNELTKKIINICARTHLHASFTCVRARIFTKKFW